MHWQWWRVLRSAAWRFRRYTLKQSRGLCRRRGRLTDQDGYVKEFIPLAAKAIAEAGGKYLARGGKTVSFQGAAPASRVIVLRFESLDKAQAWWDSRGRKESQPLGDKYATFRIFAAEGVSQ